MNKIWQKEFLSIFSLNQLTTMNRRIFTRQIILTGTGIIFFPAKNIFGQILSADGALSDDPDLKEALVYLHNTNTLSGLNNTELTNFYLVMNNKPFPPSLIPYNPQKKIKLEDVHELLQARISEANTRYDQRLANLSGSLQDVSQTRGFVKSANVSNPVVKAAMAITGLALAPTNWLVKEYGNEYMKRSLVNAVTNDFHTQRMLHNFNIKLPEILEGKMATTENLQSKLQDGTFSPAVDRRLGDQLYNQLASGNNTGLQPDILSEYFEAAGNLSGQISPAKDEPLTEQQKIEQQALVQSFYSLGKVLITKFAGEKESLILGTLLDTGMQYLALTAMGSAALGPVGWTALGVGVATALLSGGGGDSFNQTVMKAFQMIFKQLQEIRKSLQRIEERQLDMLVRLDEILQILIRNGGQLKEVKGKIDELAKDQQFANELARERNKEALEATGLHTPNSFIDRTSRFIYPITSNNARNAEINRNKTEIVAAFNSLYNYVEDYSKRIDYNGTGTAMENLFAPVYNIRNLKYRIFNPSYMPSSPGISSPTRIQGVNLYDNIGILTYIYRYYVNTSYEYLSVVLRNPLAFRNGVESYLAANLIFPQNSIAAKASRKINTIELLSHAEKTYKQINLLCDKKSIGVLLEKYLQLAEQLFYRYNEQTAGLHPYINNTLARETVFNPPPGQTGESAILLNKILPKFELRTTGNSLKKGVKAYIEFEMPFNGITAVSNRTLAYPIRDFVFIRDYAGLTFPNERNNDNFLTHDKSYQESNNFELLDIISVFNIARVNKVDSYQAGFGRRQSYYTIEKALTIGHAFRSDLYEMELRDIPSLPFLNKVKILFTYSKTIGGIKETPDRSFYGPNNRVKLIFGYRIITAFYYEYSFCPTPELFPGQIKTTWKQQIINQLKTAGKEKELEKIPGFETISLRDFIFFLIDKRMLEYKDEKLFRLGESIDTNHAGKHNFDHIAPSLYISSRLNQVIISKGKIPFTADYADLIFRIEDLQSALGTLRNFDINTEEGKYLYNDLKVEEAKEYADFERNQTTFNYLTSLFYYKKDYDPAFPKTPLFGKLDIDNYFDFIIIYLRSRIMATAKYVENTASLLDNEKHAEPLLAESMLMLKGYIAALEG